MLAQAVAFVALTHTVVRTVDKVHIAARPDRWIENGPGGGGWASASFDAPRIYDAIVTFTDGHEFEYCYSSEDEELPWHGGTMTFRREIVPVPPVPYDDIPF